MQKTLKIFSILLICTFLLISTQTNVLAKRINSSQNQNNGCIPMDLIFILGASTENIEWVFDAFALQQLTRCTNSNQVSQIAVVSTVPPEKKGEDYIVLPLTPINPTSIETWEKQRQTLFSKVNNAPYVDNPRNILSGFETAFDLLNLNSYTNPDRKKVIIYIGYPVTSLGSGIVPAYFNNFLDELNQYAKGINKDSLSIYAILTPDHGTTDINPDRDLNYLHQATGMNAFGEYQGWNKITDKFGGKVFPDTVKYYSHNWQIANSIFEILQNTTGLESQPFGCGQYSVNPYQASMELYFFSDTQAQNIEISYESDTGNIISEDLYEIKNSDLGFVFPNVQLEKNKVFLISDPLPGVWRINVAGETCDTMMGYSVFSQPEYQVTFPESPLSQYDLNGETYDPNDKQTATIELQDRSTGNTLRIWDKYPPLIDSTVTQSDIFSESLNFSQITDYQLGSDPINVANEGVYQWEINIDLPKFTTNNSIEYERSETVISGEYEVAQIRQILIEFNAPQKNEKTTLHDSLIPGFLQINPVHVNIKLKDQIGHDLNAQTVFRDPDNSISMTLIEKNTNKVIAEGEFLQVSEEDPSSLSGKIGGGVQAAPGEYDLILTIVGEVDSSRYRIPQEENSISFIRQDTIFSSPIFWYCIAGILVLFALILMIQQIYLYKNPVLGELHFKNIELSHTIHTLKLGQKGKYHYRRSYIAKNIPILKFIHEIKIQHANRKSGSGILLEVKPKDGSTKRGVLKNGDTLVINNLFEATYSIGTNEEEIQSDIREDGDDEA